MQLVSVLISSIVPTATKRQLAYATVGCACWVLGGQPNFDPNSLCFDSESQLTYLVFPL